MLQLLAPPEVDEIENEQQTLLERVNELEKQLQSEREKNTEKTFSIFGHWQAGVDITTSKFVFFNEFCLNKFLFYVRSQFAVNFQLVLYDNLFLLFS